MSKSILPTLVVVSVVLLVLSLARWNGHTGVAVGGHEPASDAANGQRSQSTRSDPESSKNAENEAMPQLETATFGAGCFWCVEAVLLRIDGIESVASGYMGGEVPNPTYEAVCTGRTGHAEVVQVKFDPQRLPYTKLLDIFWQLHDPTTLNRQGPDVGTQYRSAIFHHSDQQRQQAEESKRQWNAPQHYAGAIVTEITPASEFYQAEAYHQDFFNKNPSNAYCRINILPKFKKLGLLRESD
jgi:peptide-methionine (S)-S-oxide reductase